MNKKKILANIILVLIITLFALLCLFFLQDKLVFLDGQSIYYPAKHLLEYWTLNLGDVYNQVYNTHYFKFIFSDTVININWNNEIFPTQQVSIILFYAVFMGLLWLKSFFYLNLILWILSITFSFLILKELYKKEILQVFWTMLIGFLPLFILYIVIPQNIIPAVFFLLLFFYSLLKYKKTQLLSYLFIWTLSFVLCCYIRIPMALFWILFIPYLFKKNTALTVIIVWSVIWTCLISLFLLLNLKYFWKLDFIWYFHVNDRPILSEYWSLSQPIYQSWYRDLLISLKWLLLTLYKFFKGSFVIFSPTIFISLRAFATSKMLRKNNLFWWVIICFILNLLYYSNLESQLRYDQRIEFKRSLTTVFFRYMLPCIVLMLFLVPQFIRRISKLTFLSIIFWVITIYPFKTIKYPYWASLSYFNEVEEKRVNYWKKITNNWSIPQDSTILYDERIVQYYLFPYVDKYHRFCYYCIPPLIRYDHTQNIIKKLLYNKKQIYFASFEEPYNERSKDMEVFLKQNFNLDVVSWSNFNREKFKFYRVINEK